MTAIFWAITAILAFLVGPIGWLLWWLGFGFWGLNAFTRPR